MTILTEGSIFMTEGFNKKLLRGAKVLKAVERIEVAIEALELQKSSLDDRKARESLELKIEGLRMAIDLMEKEFRE